jgi:hypothetical protein
MSGVLPNMSTYIPDTWIPNRRSVILNAFSNENLFTFEGPEFNINGFPLRGGEISTDDELTMDNPNGSGILYYTIDGTDPRQPGSMQIISTTLVTEDADKRVLVPIGPVDANWKSDPVFDDSGWNHGTPIIPGKSGGVGYETGSGYENYITYNVQAGMYGNNATCYIRIPFTVDACDLAGLNFMTLKMRYDDGFVAYINGEKVYSVFEPSPIQWNSVTDNGGSHEAGANFDKFPVSDHISALQPGVNILAIHGLNVSNTSTDFLISAELVAGEANSTVGISPSAKKYTGTPLTFDMSTQVRARVLDGITWSALNEAIFAIGPLVENLRITEVMYHPRNTGNINYVPSKEHGQYKRPERGIH